jgi:membrane peptidoglycan carboxypeptidase
MNAGDRGLKNGPEKIADFARRCGITTRLPKHPKPSIVLGAYEISPLEMASAYATIANGGRRVQPTAISMVVSHEDDEKVLYVAPEHPEGKQVISEDIANEATGIIVGDVTEGISKDASLGDRPVAGETGTSENWSPARGWATPKAVRHSNTYSTTPADYKDSQAASPRPRFGRRTRNQS